LTAVGFTAVGFTEICMAFRGDTPLSGAFLVIFLTVGLVFLTVVVFLRVDALTLVFLRFALVFPVAFFRLAIAASLTPVFLKPAPNRCSIKK
jgi:hypothetical protein